MKKEAVNSRIVITLFLLISFLFLIIRNAYIFYSDPHHKKNLLEYSLLHFRENKKEFDELGEYYTKIKTKYPQFSIVKDFKQGLICRPIGPFEEDSSFVADTIVHDYGLVTYTEISAPEKKHLDFKLTEGDEYLMEKHGITQITSKTDTTGGRYLQLYSEVFNKLVNQREIILYYFPDNVSRPDIITNYYEFKNTSDITDKNQGFFVEDNHWLFLIKNTQ